MSPPDYKKPKHNPKTPSPSCPHAFSPVAKCAAMHARPSIASLREATWARVSVSTLATNQPPLACCSRVRHFRTSPAGGGRHADTHALRRNAQLRTASKRTSYQTHTAQSGIVAATQDGKHETKLLIPEPLIATYGTLCISLHTRKAKGHSPSSENVPAGSE